VTDDDARAKRLAAVLNRVLVACSIVAVLALSYLVAATVRTASDINDITGFTQSTNCRTEQLREYADAITVYLAIPIDERNSPPAEAASNRVSTAFETDC